jgi:hypothetical protein
MSCALACWLYTPFSQGPVFSVSLIGKSHPGWGARQCMACALDEAACNLEEPAHACAAYAELEDYSSRATQYEVLGKLGGQVT